MNKGFGMIDVIAYGIIALIIAAICIIPMLIHFSSIGNGQHSGYVTAVDYRGYVFPNYVVYFKTDTQSSQEDDYCVSRDDVRLAEDLKRAAQTKERITISYHGVRAFGIGICVGTQIDSLIKD